MLTIHSYENAFYDLETLNSIDTFEVNNSLHKQNEFLTLNDN